MGMIRAEDHHIRMIFNAKGSNKEKLINFNGIHNIFTHSFGYPNSNHHVPFFCSILSIVYPDISSSRVGYQHVSCEGLIYDPHHFRYSRSRMTIRFSLILNPFEVYTHHNHHQLWDYYMRIVFFCHFFGSFFHFLSDFSPFNYLILFVLIVSNDRRLLDLINPLG